MDFELTSWKEKGPKKFRKNYYVDEVRFHKLSCISKLSEMRMPGLLRFGIKAGIMSSAVYLTIDKGVWKDSETTGELFEELREQLKPYVKPIVNQIPFEIPKLPQTGDVASTAKTTWNKGVMASCLFLVQLPELTWEYVKKGSALAYEKINELQIANEAQTTNEQKTSNS